MADPIKYDEVDPKNDQLEVDSLSTGKRLLGLAYLLEGTTASGETLAPSDLGRFVLDLYGDQRYNVPIGFYNAWPRIHAGSVAKTLPTNGATSLGGFVPMWVPGAGVQTVPIRQQNDFDGEFQLDNSVLSTRFGSNDVSFTVAPVYADRVPSRYVPQYKKATLQFNSATSLDEDFTQGNYPSIWIREAADNANADIIDRFDITVDQQEQTQKLGLALSDVVATVLAEIETPNEPWKFQDLTDATPDQGGYRNAQVTVDVTTNNNGNIEIITGRRVPASSVSGVSL